MKQTVESWSVTIHNRPNAKTEIVDGNIEAYAYGSAGSCLYNYGEIVIYGGNIYSEKCPTILTNDWGELNTKLTINGGSIVCKNGGYALQNSNLGTVDIFGGVISGISVGVATIWNSGTLNIQGGTISAEDMAALYNVKPGVANISNGRLTSQKTCIGNESTLNVTGGIIEGLGGFSILNNTGTVNVTGGTLIGNKGY